MPLACVDTLAAGSLLAVLLHDAKTFARWRARYAMAGWIGVAGMIADMTLHHFDLAVVPRFVFGEVALSLFAIGVLSRATVGYSGIARAVLEFKPLVYIGTISYGLYVYHAIAQSFVDVLIESHRVSRPPAELRMVIEFGLSFLVAALSWRFFERPINRLKRYFPYERPLGKEACAVDEIKVSPVS
jgi:peptidoglycan/LPS O-acetylase OafA/YrhL